MMQKRGYGTRGDFLTQNDEIREEFVGEVVSDGFLHDGFWQALGAHNPTLLGKVYAFVKSLIERARAAFPGYTPRTAEYLTDFDKVMRIAGAVVGKYRAAKMAAEAQALTAKFNRPDDSERTARLYGGRAAYERARAAGRTKLTYGQWLEVRTPAFKAWFGDWELAQPAMRSASTFDEARAHAKAFQGRDLTNEATGLVGRVSRNSLDKMLHEKAVGKSESPARHAAAVANLDRLFERATLGWSKADAKKDPNVVAVHRFFAPINLDGRAYLAKITAIETADRTPNRVYSVESVEFNEKSPAAQWVAASAAADGVDLTSTRSARDVVSLAQRIQTFNPEPVSKVVDPDTGEPLVVYHGTDDDISTFDLDRLGVTTESNTGGDQTAIATSKMGFWFHERALTGEMGVGAAMPVYIALETPLTTLRHRDLWTLAHNLGDDGEAHVAHVPGSGVRRSVRIGA
jgi:hypothetical protein